MFTVKIKVPSGKTVRVPEIKNKNHLTLLKFCENTDLEGLGLFFEETIFSNIPKSKELTIIDRFYILVYLRMVFIEPNIIFKDQQDRNINFNLSNILHKIDQHENDFSKTVYCNEFVIELGLPNMIYYKDVDDIYTGCIKSIKINDKNLKFETITAEEKDVILKYLPSTVFDHITKYIKDVSQKVKDFVLIEKNDPLNIEEINIDIMSNGVINFIQALYAQNLKSYYELNYFFMCKLHMPYEAFGDLTPIETKVIINIYDKEQEERKKAELQNNSH